MALTPRIAAKITELRDLTDNIKIKVGSNDPTLAKIHQVITQLESTLAGV